jgi:hypothetical protein
MKDVRKVAKGPAPVAGVVHTILASAKSVNAKHANPMTDRHAADMTSALTYAAQALAKAEAPVVEIKATPLQRVLASIGLASNKAVAGAKRGAPKLRAIDKGRIEDVLKSSMTGSSMMSLEDIVKAEQQAVNEGAHCVLPDGAVDPICEPR